MADHHVPTFSTKPLTEREKAREFEEHARTYEGFLTGAKWCTIFTVAILVILYFVFIF